MINFDNPTLKVVTVEPGEWGDWGIIATWWDGESRMIEGPMDIFEACHLKIKLQNKWDNK